MYGIVKVQVNKHNSALFSYCQKMTTQAKNLKNASLFRIRQWFTSCGAKTLQPLQQEVVDEVEKTAHAINKSVPKGKVLSYTFLEKLMRVTENPDFFDVLPMQSAQHIVKHEVQDFKNWLSALSVYKTNPSAFTGKPKMPKYLKSEETTVPMTNQDCRLYEAEDGSHYLKLPLTSGTVKVEIPSDARLKQVEIKPYYGDYLIIIIYESKFENTQKVKPLYEASLDLGVNNIAAFVSNDGQTPILFQGGAVKAMNQKFDKYRAKYVGILEKAHKPGTVSLNTHRLLNLSMNRANDVSDTLHKISARIIRECLARNIGVLYIGKNKQWKTETCIGKKNNQTFTKIPHNTLIWMITYKAERAGIQVIEQEESYTSQASILDGDYIPTYGVDDDKANFSGVRFMRGLYRSKDGTVLNADVNGAANILRKANPHAFEGTKDFGFLQELRVIGYRGLNPIYR